MRPLPLFNLPLGIVAILATPAITESVYNPARAFLSPKSNGELAYLFLPTTTTPSIYQFLALNTSSTLDAASLPYSTLSAAYKSPGNPQNTTFTPFIDRAGDIFVHTGGCSSGASGSRLWRYSPEPNANNGDGTWSLRSVKTEALDGSGLLSGANYLSSGIAFSSIAGKEDEDASLYVFGGMCPFAHSTSGSWTADAQYSNSMLTFLPMASSDSSSSQGYTLGLSQSRGPPIPEAGFSITPLSPTFSDQSTGSKNQQQNFVLLGGHTQTAFINMSQVALFSLPVQSWSFLTVDPPVSRAKTDLTTRDSADNVDPRSGHTSVLTEDGKMIIVFGGWVGDVHTPADPQLAVLQVGEDYGGTGEWGWKIPSQRGSGPAPGSGIYGHAAVMLPGGIMMVVGGYSIPPLSSSNSKDKRNDAALNTQNLFYNTTSNAWVSSYTNPALSQRTSTSTNIPGGAQDHKSSVLSSTSQKAGLGVGLVLGLLFLVGAAIVYLWFARRRARQIDAREKELRDLASGADRFQLSRADSDGEKSAVNWTAGRPRQLRDPTYPWPPGESADGHGWRNSGVVEAERTGLLVEIPSPTRGLRRSLHSRGAYQPAPRFDDGRRRSIGPGSIHPIDERDEYEYSGLEVLSTRRSEDVAEEIQPIATSPGPTLDPFQDPNPLRCHPIESLIPSTAHDREREVQNWVSDWAAADAIMHAPARTPSPDKDRTSSTLSEQSTRSTGSNQSLAFSRSLSQRSAARFTAISNPFSSPNHSPTHDQYPSGGRRSPPQYRRSQSLVHFPHNRPGTSNTNDSFATAATSFQQLQTEGEALLGGRPTGNPSAPESPTKIKGRSLGWMGSMRRALPLSLGGERSASPLSASGGRDSASPSPTKYHDALPRRAASASAATLWRKKQGAADWDAEMNDRQLSPSPEGAEGEVDEWDVEAAVERRVVQVMFTVPKEKLRVVNAGDADGASVSDVGEEDFLGPGKGKGVAKRGTF